MHVGKNHRFTLPVVSDCFAVVRADGLLISLYSCRWDTFRELHKVDRLPQLSFVGPLHQALAPS